MVTVSASDGESSKPSPVGLATASLCFGLCILAVLCGIAVILYGKRMFGGMRRTAVRRGSVGSAFCVTGRCDVQPDELDLGLNEAQ